MLLNAAGLELSPYEQFLLEVQKEYPAMNAFGYYDADWNWHDRTDENGRMSCCGSISVWSIRMYLIKSI